MGQAVVKALSGNSWGTGPVPCEKYDYTIVALSWHYRKGLDQSPRVLDQSLRVPCDIWNTAHDDWTSTHDIVYPSNKFHSIPCRTIS